MKSFIAGLCLSAVSLLAFEEVNILLNTNFEGDTEFFPGTLGVWNVDMVDADRQPITVLKGEGPGGANAVRLNIPAGEVFRQQEVKLEAGERYRFGAFVRTQGFVTPTSSIRVWNRGWTGELISMPIPRDTGGKWIKIEGEGIMPKSVNGIFTYGLYAKTPSGILDFACPYLIPLSEKALANSKVMAVPDVKLDRIVPVYPLLMKLDVKNPRMKFFVPCQLTGNLADYELIVETKMENHDADWSRKSVYSLAQGRLVDTFLGNLPAGDGKMRVAVRKRGTDQLLVTSEYNICVINVPPKPQMKHLNNMVCELLEVPLKDGDITFENPREGWVFIGFDQPYQATKAYLNGGEKPVVYYREHELSDTMRLLPIGTHTLHIENAPANGRLIIRAVAQIMLYPIGVAEKADYSQFRYDMDFFKRHLFHAVNLFDSETWLPKTDFAKMVDAELAERGMKIVGSRGLFRKESPAEVDKMVAAIRSNETMKRNWGLTIDELSMGANPTLTLATIDALWQLTDLEKRVYLWCCGVSSGFFSNPFIHHNLLSAGSNVSRSEGKIFLETYIGTRRTEEEAYKALEYIPKQLEIARQLTVDAAERFMMLMSGYTTPEVWCINNYPQADIKVMFDKFFHILATDPRMDGLFGMGCYSIGHTDEELVRWIGKLMRYYCVEGGTEMLSKKYGFTYEPGHLKDGDFEEAFKYWEVEAAEEGSIVHKILPGYGGSGYQWRIGREKGLGDSVALFTRSASKPNRLSQTAVGLTPGKLYCLSFMSIDYDDFLKPTNKHHDIVFDATISDADIIPDVTGTRICPQVWYGSGDYKPGTPEKAIRRIVFRPRKEMAKITFCDWKTPTEPGAPAGERRVVNWIGLKPYFTE